MSVGAVSPDAGSVQSLMQQGDAYGSQTPASSSASGDFDKHLQAGEGKLSDVSTAEDAVKQLFGDKNPGTNEADRVGGELGDMKKLADLGKQTFGLATHQEAPSSLAGKPKL